MTEYRYAGREYLSGKGRRGMKMIDMEYIYREIDGGIRKDAAKTP